MLVFAIPGFLMIKSRIIKDDAISAFAKLLLYVCQPCLLISSLTEVECTKKTALDLLTVFAVILVSELIMTGLLLLVFRRKQEEARFRIYTVASCMGNVGFMGVPVIKALLPGDPEAVAMTVAASLALNVYGWTIASAVISRDRKYISPKKLLLNPATLAIAVAVPLFATNTPVPGGAGEMIALIGRFSTPLCMIVMGARLACARFKDVFLRVGNYLTVILKQAIYPLLVLLLIYFLPLDRSIKYAVYIIACCPVASMVLNFSELMEKGREEAAGVLLLGTALSCLTLPLMLLII